MSNQFKIELKDFISQSDLDTNQKMLWDLFLKLSSKEEDEAVLEAAQEEDGNLKLLTVHLRDKIWDMKENNHEAWMALTNDEEKYASIL